MKTLEQASITAMGDDALKSELQIDIVQQALGGKLFANLTPYEIVARMVYITERNLVLPKFLENQPASTGFKDKLSSFFGSSDKDMMAKWSLKFKQIKAHLRMFGVDDVDAVYNEIGASKKRAVAQSKVTQAQGSQNTMSQVRANYDHKALMNFRPLASVVSGAADISYMTCNYKDNLEIINEIRSYINYEFFLDSTGEIIFKPYTSKYTITL